MGGTWIFHLNRAPELEEIHKERKTAGRIGLRFPAQEIRLHLSPPCDTMGAQKNRRQP